MTHQFIILAERAVTGELLRRGGLQNLLTDAGENENTVQEMLSGHIHTPFVRIDPSFVVAPSDESCIEDAGMDDDLSGAARYELRDRIFAHFANKTVCHIVVVQEDEKKGSGRDIMDVTKEGSAHLFRLRQWYDRFSEEAQQRNRHLHIEYRHVLVLVLASETADKNDEKELQTLLNWGRPKHFCACFMMLRQLNTGLAAGSQRQFHSRQVWPASVGRLLCALKAHSDFGSGISDDYRGVYAWRAETVVIPRESEGQPLLALIEEQRRRMATESENDIAARVRVPDIPGPIPVQPRLPPKTDLDAFSNSPWLKVDPGHYRQWAQRISDPNRWESDLRRTGLESARESLLRQRWTGGVKQILDAYWSAVQMNPMGADQAYKQLDAGKPKDVHDRLAESVASWDLTRTLELKRRALLKSLQSHAGYMKDTCYGFVSFPIRVLIAMVVCSLAGYVLAALFGALAHPRDEWRWILGGVLTLLSVNLLFVIYCRIKETMQGARDHDRFARLLRESEEQVLEKDSVARNSLARAAEFQNAMRFRQAAIWVELLLDRIRILIHGEMTASSDLLGRPVSNTFISSQEKELRDFEQFTRHEVGLQEINLEQRRREAADAWCRGLTGQWTTFSQPFPPGHIPAGRIVAFMSRQMEDLKDQVDAASLDGMRAQHLEELDRLLENRAGEGFGVSSQPFLSLLYSPGDNGVDEYFMHCFVVRPMCPEQICRKRDGQKVPWYKGPVPGGALGVYCRMIRIVGLAFNPEKKYWEISRDAWTKPGNKVILDGGSPS